MESHYSRLISDLAYPIAMIFLGCCVIFANPRRGR